MAVGNLVAYALVNALGMMYFNIVTLTSERPCPIYDFDFKTVTFFKTVFLTSPILFLTSFLVNLTAKQDLDGFCHHNSAVHQPLSIA